MKGPGIVSLALLCGLALGGAHPRAALAQTWTPLRNQPNFAMGAGTALLLTDGTVLVHDEANGGGPDWMRLTPDSSGSYVNGTWSSAGVLPGGYAPLYFASAVLGDGRVAVLGGEYNGTDGTGGDTNLAAIYDPKTNSWSPLSGPGWVQIGDAESCMLPDGRMMLADQFASDAAALDPLTMSWSPIGTGKADPNSEEGWELLPDGNILTIDTQNGNHAEKFNIASGQWISAGDLPFSITSDGGLPIVPELGPGVLRPDGSLIALGGNGHNAVYLPPANPTDPGSWIPAQDFPNTPAGQFAVADGPACLLPNGNVLVGASPFFNPPVQFFEFDANNNLNQVPNAPNAPGDVSFIGRMLLLPTGQVLYTDGSNDVEIYTPSGGPKTSWRPTITSAPLLVTGGNTYTVSGTQFNGLSQAVGYGDDASAATNYPLVRITNHVTGHVVYCRTHDHSTFAVATGSAIVSTNFDAPANLEPGLSDLVVVANGISSAPRLLNGLQIAPASVSVSPSTVTQFNPSTGTVTLSQAANLVAAPVVLKSSDPAVVSVPSEVDVQAGNLTATFPIATGGVATLTPVTITATAAGVSVTTTLTVSPPPPNSPVNLIATALGSDQVLLNWVNGGGKYPTNSYIVQRQTGLGAWTNVGGQVGVGTTQILDTGLASGTLYRYRVLAVGDGGQSPPSNIAIATTTSTPPGTPSGLTAAAISTTEIDLSWVPYNGDPSVKFVVEHRLSGGSYVTLTPTPIAATSFKDTGLKSGTTYFYHVRAVNSAGASGFSSEVSAQTQVAAVPPPAAPTGLNASISGGQVSLSWTDNNGDYTGFKIERKPVGGTYSQINLTPVTSTSYSDPGAAPNRPYTYRVKATNSAGDSGYSNEVTITLSTDLISGTVSVASVGQPGVAMQLLNSANTIIARATTDNSGSYAFMNLADGAYTVKAIVPGLAQAQSQTVTLAAVNGAPGSAIVNFNVSNIHTFAKGLSLVSAPFDYTSSPFDALAVFGLPSPGAGATAPIASYDPIAKAYDYYPNLPGTKTTPGRGYWVLESNATPFRAIGAVITTPTYDVTVQPGWNLIGNPYAGATDWSAVHVKLPFRLGAAAAGYPISMGAAMAYRILQQPYSYTGSGTTIPGPPSPSGSNSNYSTATSIAPFAGYWVYVNPFTTRGAAIQLSFTNPNP